MSAVRASILRALGVALSLFIAGTGCDKSVEPAPAPPASTTPAAPPSPAWVEDATEKIGLNFVHDVGPVGTYFMPESLGSGTAVFDFDGDVRMDVFLLQNAGTNSTSKHQLFHQENDGRFRDVSAGSGLDLPGRGMGVAVGDVDNDGKPDVFITEYDRVRLFQNRGSGKFREITREAGITNSHWGMSAAFFDYDRDGWLDLIVVNYVDYSHSNKCYDPQGSCTIAGRPDSRHGFEAVPEPWLPRSDPLRGRHRARGTRETGRARSRRRSRRRQRGSLARPADRERRPGELVADQSVQPRRKNLH
jgi:hypothetical protein